MFLSSFFFLLIHLILPAFYVSLSRTNTVLAQQEQVSMSARLRYRYGFACQYAVLVELSSFHLGISAGGIPPYDPPYPSAVH